MTERRRYVYRGRCSGSVPRPAISEERFTQLVVLGLGGGLFLLGVRTVEDERAARIHFEANVAQLCFFDCAIRRQAFSGWDNVIAALFSRLLLAESAYAFRRLIPEILQAIERPIARPIIPRCPPGRHLSAYPAPDADVRGVGKRAESLGGWRHCGGTSA